MIKHSHWGLELMNLIPFSGSMIKTLVESASASMVVLAVTETLVSERGEVPVLGLTI